MINTGNNLQSLGLHKLGLVAHAQSEEKGEEPKKTVSKPWRSWTWLVGTIIFVSGALLTFYSFGLAPQSLLAPIESIQFVTNVFLGKLLLGRFITKRMYFGTFLTVFGTLLAILFCAKKSAERIKIQDLIDLWNNYLWICYLIFVGGFAAFLDAYRARQKRLEDRGNSVNKNINAVIYSVFSALFGTLSVVFAKLLAELLSFQTQGILIFSHWFTYAVFSAWLFLMIYWLYRLNFALGIYDPLFIIPLLQANFIFFAIVSGGIHFMEFNYMSPWQWVGFTSGVGVMFYGLFLLAPATTKSSSHQTPSHSASSSVSRQPMIKVMPTIPEKPDSVSSSAEGGLNPPSLHVPTGTGFPEVSRKRTWSISSLMTLMLMSGAGRMNYEYYNLLSRKKQQEKALDELKLSQNLSPPEQKLAKMLNNYIYGAERTLQKQKELAEIIRTSPKTDLYKNHRSLSLIESVERFKTKLQDADNLIKRQSLIVESTKSCPSLLDLEARARSTPTPRSRKQGHYHAKLSLSQMSWSFNTVNGVSEDQDDPNLSQAVDSITPIAVSVQENEKASLLGRSRDCFETDRPPTPISVITPIDSSSDMKDMGQKSQLCDAPASKHQIESDESSIPDVEEEKSREQEQKASVGGIMDVGSPPEKYPNIVRGNTSVGGVIVQHAETLPKCGAATSTTPINRINQWSDSEEDTVILRHRRAMPGASTPHARGGPTEEPFNTFDDRNRERGQQRDRSNERGSDRKGSSTSIATARSNTSLQLSGGHVN